MEKLGKKQLTLNLSEPMSALPPELSEWDLTLKADGNEIEYVFDGKAERTGIPSLLRRMSDLGIGFKDLNTRQSSLEDIFVSLVTERKGRMSSAPAFNARGVWAIYRFEMHRFKRTLWTASPCR
jgi:hypothetical protein